MDKRKEKVKVLFICTGNSCRSQMAEGWARHLKGDVIDAYSAGIQPAGVSSRAIKAMAEVGIDISCQSSKHVDELAGVDFDYVVTLCDYAKEHCPIFPGETKQMHRSFEDPSAVWGSDDEIMTAFRKTRDDIRNFIETLPESLHSDSEFDT
jgi:arsenate reductase